MSDSTSNPSTPTIPTGPAAGTWIAHFSAEGRPYWNHTGTKVSVWEKPDELKTELELEMGKTSWKEYETNGRKYWVSKESGETTWDMPQVLKGEFSLWAMGSAYQADSVFILLADILVKFA